MLPPMFIVHAMPAIPIQIMIEVIEIAGDEDRFVGRETEWPDTMRFPVTDLIVVGRIGRDFAMDIHVER